MTYVRWQDRTPVEADLDSTSQLNLTSTTFTQVSPRVSSVFTAPKSGKVFITVGGTSRDNSSTNRAYIAVQVDELFEDESTVLAAGDVTNAFNGGPETARYFHGERTVMLPGLAAGRQYIARVVYSVDGGTTADIGSKSVIVEPVR